MNAVADTLIVVLVFAIVAQAWSWLGAYAGIVSLGHAVFFGIGAYAVAVSNVRGGSPWYGALGGGLIAVVVAGLTGGLFVRGRGTLFAAVTLAAGLLAAPLIAAQHWVGPDNVFAFPIRHGFLELQFDQKWPYLTLALIVFAVTQGLTLALRRSRIGYYLRAARINAVAARSAGVAARPAQLLALVVSAFVTAVAGSFYAQYTRGVDPHVMFAPALSFDVALVALIAGPASAWGAPLAALAFVLIGKALPLHPAGAAGTAVLVVEGLLIVALWTLRPEGLLTGPTRPSRGATVRGNV